MQHQTERKQNVNRRESVGELAASSEAQYPSSPAHVETSGLVRSFPLLPGETSGPPQRCGCRRVRKDLMARGPEESGWSRTTTRALNGVPNRQPAGREGDHGSRGGQTAGAVR